MRKILIIFIFALLLFSCYEVEADQFTSQFYGHVNILRESRDLVPLKRNRKLEKVANAYSAIMAEEKNVDHNLLTEFEFNSLCTNYDLPTSTLLEVLASCPEGYVSYQVFLLFVESESHKAALLNLDGRFIGAGYIYKEGRMYFTAYVMKEKS